MSLVFAETRRSVQGQSLAEPISGVISRVTTGGSFRGARHRTSNPATRITGSPVWPLVEWWLLVWLQPWGEKFDGGRHMMGTLAGTVSLTGLPPHRGLILNLCLYSVPAADTPAPNAGDPPAEAATDCHEVYQQVNLDEGG